MSTIGGGTATSGFDNLSALLEFVKSPDYADRIRELRDQEQASRDAIDRANAAIAEAAEKSAKLAADQAAHQAAARALASDKAAHDRRIALWGKAMAGVQKALRGED